MPSKLDVFDFDGTLFDSPEDTPKTREKYERTTGLPWLIDKTLSRELSQKHRRHIGIRRGWWGRAETLEPPLVPDPAPREWFKKDICDQFFASKVNSETLTLIVTGRHVGLREQVMRIIHDGGLAQIDVKQNKEGKKFYRWSDSDCQLFCLGDDGPLRGSNKPSETFPWKVWLVQQFIENYSDIKTIEIWEDRDEHVEKFKELHGALAETVIVNHVK